MIDDVPAVLPGVRHDVANRSGDIDRAILPLLGDRDTRCLERETLLIVRTPFRLGWPSPYFPSHPVRRYHLVCSEHARVYPIHWKC